MSTGNKNPQSPGIKIPNSWDKNRQILKIPNPREKSPDLNKFPGFKKSQNQFEISTLRFPLKNVVGLNERVLHEVTEVLK